MQVAAVLVNIFSGQHSGTNNELRISEQWLETGNTYLVRSVSINTDNLLEVELATFSPTVSATGQSLLLGPYLATQFSVSVDNLHRFYKQIHK